MAQVFDISNWLIKEWIPTIGTRDKFFVEDPSTGKQYFFKESIKKFPAEFWSEIIASKYGDFLGFDILDYNVGISGEIVGCLCESMIDQTHEELEHGIGLIKRSKPGFKISDRPDLYFDDVIKSLKTDDFVKCFLEIMIFDALIGNQDRHSENWAVIKSLNTGNISSGRIKIIKWWYDRYKSSGLKLKNLPFKKYFLSILHKEDMLNIKFSPIYDNGSSLGREIDESSINKYLDDPSKLLGYIQHGRSEIRWDGKKINHFKLLNLIHSEFPDHVQLIIKRVTSRFNEQAMEKLIYTIDTNLGSQYDGNKLTLNRKKLIFQLIRQRYLQLQNIIKNG